ncbi:MAG: sterol desaturase/sphingolipid hydroxylase (fatty acid hydroxylase superfamily) [Oceanicoccus sp.]|jgi:sterol desaturase/sphingolipid hydroxylase (fatty acid hydroxylase superfamily)
MTSIEAAEPIIRLSFSVGVLAFFIVLETLYPRRQRILSRLKRWPSNIGLSLLNQLIARLIMPATAIAVAAYGATSGMGLLNYMVMPTWLEIIIAVLLLDLAIYLQHIMFHSVPLFWRMHRVHHADTDFDVSTGVRFHPVEIILSAAIKLAVIILLGPAVIAILIFEVWLNAASIFNHSNLRIPLGLDKLLRNVVVTPDMHRVHHSIRANETNSNFGFNFPWWDRFFGTYRAQPIDGHEDMTIGLDKFRQPNQQRIHRLLLQPFQEVTDMYSISRRENEP